MTCFIRWKEIVLHLLLIYVYYCQLTLSLVSLMLSFLWHICCFYGGSIDSMYEKALWWIIAFIGWRWLPWWRYWNYYLWLNLLSDMNRVGRCVKTVQHFLLVIACCYFTTHCFLITLSLVAFDPCLIDELMSMNWLRG